MKKSLRFWSASSLAPLDLRKCASGLGFIVADGADSRRALRAPGPPETTRGGTSRDARPKPEASHA